MKILLVEDDKTLSLALSDVLKQHNYAVEIATDGEIGLDLATSCEYDLLLIDWLLPKLDGISLCRQLRARGYNKPILLVTGKDSNTDIAQGLDAGADDYLIKPYDITELLARLRALLRRRDSPVATALHWDKLSLDSVSCQVTYDDQPLSLTATEYNLLEFFLHNPNRVFSRSAIIERLWSVENAPIESAITVHIAALRQKLKAAGLTSEIIQTIYGMGYQLNPPPKEDNSSHPNLAERIASVQNVLERYRDTFIEQVGTLEEVLQALQSHSLHSSLQEKAQQEAHKLAGSLGTFGYPKGSELARKAERLLKEPLTPPQGRQLQEWAEKIKKELQKPPALLEKKAISKPQSCLILVISEDVSLTQQLESAASEWDLKIEGVTNFKSAEDFLFENQPNAIVLDLNFAHSSQDGLESLEILHQQFPKIPILVLTEEDSLSLRVAVSRLGGQGFLHQPIAFKQIVRAIAQILPSPQPSEAKVLLVDDDPLILTRLYELLSPWGLEVKKLETPEKFWEVLSSFCPDLLILDSEMPTYSGIELCQVVRQDSQWGNLPILVVAAHTDDNSLLEAFDAGADDVINKPILAPELITRVLSRIERIQLQRKSEISTQETP